MIPVGDDSPSPALKKGPWSATEDRILIEYVREHGEGNWNAVQRNTSLQRCGKSCRLRWANHLRPNLKKGAFSSDEERLIIDLHSKLGNKWARISAHLPGRTDNEVKNYWNTRVKRRLRHGLPLYPHTGQQSPSSLSSLPPPPQPQHPPNPPPAPPLPVLKTAPSNLPFLDPASLPFPAPFFSFNNPSFTPPNYFSPGQIFHHGFNSLNSVNSETLGLGFEYKLELPSNQFRPNLAADDDDGDEIDDAIDEVKFNPNVGERSNSGLLDALLQEAQSRAEAARRSDLKNDSLDGDQWDSIYANSSSDKEVAKIEEDDDHAYCTNEDLSSILNLIPSLVTPSNWNEGREDASAGQSSNISEENAGLEIPSYTSWDNLPTIC